MPTTPKIDVSEVLEARSARLFDIQAQRERLGRLGFIPGSFHVDFEEAGREKIRRAGRADGAIVYCLTGGRSRRAVTLLRGEEPELSVVSVAGGLVKWRSEGLPTVTLPEGFEQEFVARQLDGIRDQLRVRFLEEAPSRCRRRADGEALDYEERFAEIVRRLGRAPSARDYIETLNKVADLALECGLPLEYVARHLQALVRLENCEPGAHRSGSI